MAEAIPGYLLEQKVQTVANNDTDINAAIAAAAVEDTTKPWIVTSLTLSGSNIIILFTRQYFSV